MRNLLILISLFFNVLLNAQPMDSIPPCQNPNYYKEHKFEYDVFYVALFTSDTTIDYSNFKVLDKGVKIYRYIRVFEDYSDAEYVYYLGLTEDDGYSSPISFTDTYAKKLFDSHKSIYPNAVIEKKTHYFEP